MRSGHHISSQLPATDPPRRGPSFHALPASLFPVPPQKHASREQRLREKVSNTFLLEEGGPRRVLLPSFVPIPSDRHDPADIRTHHLHAPDSTPRRGSKRRRDEPVSTRGKRKRGGRGEGREREREGERRIVSRDSAGQR